MTTRGYEYYFVSPCRSGYDTAERNIPRKCNVLLNGFSVQMHLVRSIFPSLLISSPFMTL
jgi:hypothetical protein